MIDKLITNWKEERPKYSDYDFGMLVYDLYSTPRNDMHDRWEDFRKEAMARKQHLKEQEVAEEFEMWMNGLAPSILRIDTVHDRVTGEIDYIMVLCKYDTNNEDKMKYYRYFDSWEIRKSVTPKFFEEAKRTLIFADKN